MTKRIIALTILLLFCGEIAMAENAEIRSEGGFFIVKTQIEPSSPVVGTNVVTLTVLDGRSKTAIDGAKIEVVPWMTVHGHGSSKKTRIKEKGKGIYVVENVYFTMTGEWDLLIKIQKDGIEDKVIVTFKNVKN